MEGFTLSADVMAGPLSFVQLSDGTRLFVKLLGSQDETKPLVIVHHGAPSFSSHKEPEASFGFLASRFRVLVYDARGSGDSDAKGPYTHQRWISDIDELRYDPHRIPMREV